jgi:hypothetical protein
MFLLSSHWTVFNTYTGRFGCIHLVTLYRSCSVVEPDAIGRNDAMLA